LKLVVSISIFLFVGTGCDTGDENNDAGIDASNNRTDAGNNGENNATIGMVTDNDGIRYNTVVIGGREWMSQNLRVRDGTEIEHVTDNDLWGLFGETDVTRCVRFDLQDIALRYRDAEAPNILGDFRHPLVGMHDPRSTL
jgi:hypothetical protein